MIAAVQRALKDMGYSINAEAYTIINACDDWYRARITDAHRRVNVNGSKYELERMGFARRIASDDANLCEIVEVNAGGSSAEQFAFVNAVLDANRFQPQYRRQLELVAAEGTAACYVYLNGAQEYSDGSIRGGEIRLNYVDALGFVPLTVINGDVVEAAFVGQNLVEGKTEHTLVVCLFDGEAYRYIVRVFDEHGQPIPSKDQDVLLGDIKPFAVMRTAQVNSLEGMDGFGFPKLYSAIPILKALDAGFTAFVGDLDSAEKITLINEMLCGFDDDGRPITPNEEMKRRFVLLGEKLPQGKDLVHEINPEIRIEAFREAIEFLLNLLAQQFGYGTKRYSFDKTGDITTATQYIGERQDMLQELGRQRTEAKEYIADIARAVLWFSNVYHGTGWDLGAEILVEFDDSLVTDKASALASMRDDILAGLGGVYLRMLYLKQKYNLGDAEAAKWAQMADPDAGSEPED